MKTIPAGDIPDKTEKDRMVSIKGVNYHYTEYPARGENVVMVHGFAASTFTWERCAEILQKQGYHVWAVDMKGFGWSDKPRDASYDPVDLMEEVYMWMKMAGFKNTILVGSSLGGAVSWGIAVKYPVMVKKLILIDSAGYNIRRPLVISLSKLPLAEETMNLFFGKWMVKLILKDVVYDDEKITDKQIEAYYDRHRTENALHAQVSLARALDSNSFDGYASHIPEIRQPTLIIWGKEDRWIPLESADSFKRDIKNSRLAVVSGCGHIAMEEKPEVTAGIIMDFLKNKPVDRKHAR